MRTIFSPTNLTAGQAYSATTVALLAPTVVATGLWWQLMLLQIIALGLLAAESRWNLLADTGTVQVWVWRASVMVSTALLAALLCGAPSAVLWWAVAGLCGGLGVATGGIRVCCTAVRRILDALTTQGHHRLYVLVLTLNGAIAAAYSVTFAFGAAADWHGGNLGPLPWAARALLALTVARTVLLHRLRQTPPYGAVRLPLRYPAGRLVPPAVFFTVVAAVSTGPLDPATAKTVFIIASAALAAVSAFADHFLPTSLTPVTPDPTPAPEHRTAPTAGRTPAPKSIPATAAVIGMAILLAVRSRANH